MQVRNLTHEDQDEQSNVYPHVTSTFDRFYTEWVPPVSNEDGPDGEHPGYISKDARIPAEDDENYIVTYTIASHFNSNPSSFKMNRIGHQDPALLQISLHGGI